jgi:hypothetical protein
MPSRSLTHAELVVLFIWELPQNLLGMLFYILNKVRGGVREVVWSRNRYFIRLRRISVCLGLFVFWASPGFAPFSFDRQKVLRHEYGHAFQSILFGPLYLLAVGVPSISRVFYAGLYRRITGRMWAGYYRGYPEKWANRLGSEKLRKIGINGVGPGTPGPSAFPPAGSSM